MFFSGNSRFSRGHQECIEAATRAMYCLVGKCRTFDLPVDLQVELFKITVVPVILYGREIWRKTMIRKVEILHMRFLKLTLCVERNTCIDFVYGKLRTYPLDIDKKVKVISYWSILINGRHEKKKKRM